MGELLEEDFESTFAWFQELRNGSDNIKRAIVIATKYAIKKCDSTRAERLLGFIEVFLPDPSSYVRRNLGPFAIGDGFMRYFPEMTWKHLKRWARSEDECVLWNVAMVFNAVASQKEPERCLKILKTLSNDRRRSVWRAAASSTIRILRRTPYLDGEVMTWPNESFKKIVRRFTAQDTPSKLL